MVIAALLLIQLYPQAFGHGIAFDSTIPQEYRDMNVALFIKVKPEVITGPVDRGSITITVRDIANNKIVEDVVLFIRIIKDNRILLEDKFNSPDGRIILDIIPNDIKPKISAFWDPDEGWRASQSLPATIEGPIFLDGGLYHFMIEVHKLEGNELPTNMILKYDSFVSIGKPYKFPVDGNTITIWNMYDKVTDLEYSNRVIRFDMPFNWDRGYLARVPLIHIDVIIPRELSDVIADEYDVRINDISIPEDALRIDTSKPNFVAVHIVLLTQHMMDIIDDVDESFKREGLAEFIVTPAKPREEIGIESLSATSSNGRYDVTISYSPSLITDTPITFILGFRDKETDAVAEATFNFLIMKDGEEIFREDNVSTIVGVGTIQYTFTEEGSYTIMLEDINSEGENVSFGISVVPEFPIAFLIISIAMSIAVAIRRL